MPRAERRLGYPIREGRRGDRRLRAAMTMMNAIVNIHRGESSVPWTFFFGYANVCRRWTGGERRSRWPGGGKTSSSVPVRPPPPKTEAESTTIRSYVGTER